MSITLEIAAAVALKHSAVMAQLGDALCAPIVTANPHLRRVLEFAHGRFRETRRLPSNGDFEVWLETLRESPMIQDGAREKLGGLLMLDVSQYDPDFFARSIIKELQAGAALVARARIMEMPDTAVTADFMTSVAQQVASVMLGTQAEECAPYRVRSFSEMKQRAREIIRTTASPALVPRMAYPGRVTMVAGREKLGKSTLVNAAGAAFIRGRPFLDGIAGVDSPHDPDERDAGYLLWLSIDEHVNDTELRFLANAGLNYEARCVIANPPNPLEFMRRALTAWDHAPQLIVIDTLERYKNRVASKPVDSGDAGAWSAVVDPLIDLARTFDVAVVIIHHASKKTGAYRDSTAIGGAVDLILEMRGVEGDTTRTISAKGRGVTGQGSYLIHRVEEPTTIRLPSRPGADDRFLLRDTYHLGPSESASTSSARTAEDREQTVTDLVAHLVANPRTSQTALHKEFGREALKRAATAGRVTWERGPKNSRLYSAVEPATS